MISKKRRPVILQIFLQSFATAITITLDEIGAKLSDDDRREIKDRLIERAGLIRDAASSQAGRERQNGESVATILEEVAKTLFDSDSS